MSSKGIAGFNAGLVRSVAGGYTPTEWATGDVITADKLNNIEQGVDDVTDGMSNIFIIRISNSMTENVSIDKTFDEIVAAHNSNKVLLAITDKYILPEVSFTAMDTDGIAFRILRGWTESSGTGFIIQQTQTFLKSDNSIREVIRQASINSTNSTAYEYPQV